MSEPNKSHLELRPDQIDELYQEEKLREFKKIPISLQVFLYCALLLILIFIFSSFLFEFTIGEDFSGYLFSVNFERRQVEIVLSDSKLLPFSKDHKVILSIKDALQFHGKIILKKHLAESQKISLLIELDDFHKMLADQKTNTEVDVKIFHKKNLINILF